MDKQLTTIYIVRHGQTGHNVADIVAGYTDSHLTEEGEKQAAKAADAFGDIKFDAVFSSDLSRAFKTAEIIALEKNIKVNTTQLIRERNFGIWENKPADEFRQKNKEALEKIKTLTEEEQREYKV